MDTPTPVVWRASLDTEHFRFEGYGATEADARSALMDGLEAHGREYGIGPEWHEPYMDDASAVRFDLGIGYRDGETIRHG